MTPTRISKIARLPHSVREELNQRLHNGEIGRTLLPWVNNLPETKKILAELFNSKPITHQNLSEWRRAGYEDWLMHQQRIAWFENLGDEESDLLKHDHSTDTFEAMSNYYIFELGRAITSLRTIKNPSERLDRLETLTREFARLQNSFNWSRRVQLEFAKFNGPNNPAEPETPEPDLASVPASHPFPVGDDVRSLKLSPAPTSCEEAQEERPSVLDCASPLPISDENSSTPKPLSSQTSRTFQTIPTPAPTTQPRNYPPAPVPNSQPPKPKNSLRYPLGPMRGGHRFVCIDG